RQAGGCARPRAGDGAQEGARPRAGDVPGHGQGDVPGHGQQKGTTWEGYYKKEDVASSAASHIIAREAQAGPDVEAGATARPRGVDLDREREQRLAGANEAARDEQTPYSTPPRSTAPTSRGHKEPARRGRRPHVDVEVVKGAKGDVMRWLIDKARRLGLEK